MKKILILSSSPNTDGLTAACVKSAETGITRAGGTFNSISLNHINIKSCMACDRGWGICRETHTCCIKDDFAMVHNQIAEADGFFFITPVYWAEMSESSKCFFDRLRRCEAIVGDNSKLFDKKVVLVAAAGGSGNGTLFCLTQMENLTKHIKGDILDRVSITKYNRRYKLTAIEEAGVEIINI